MHYDVLKELSSCSLFSTSWAYSCIPLIWVFISPCTLPSPKDVRLDNTRYEHLKTLNERELLIGRHGPFITERELLIGHRGPFIRGHAQAGRRSV